MENTDFVIEHIDEEVQVIADQPSVVTNYPANTDFFIENIDSNVISIAHSLNIEASEVNFRPANTDFFIENIDKNVIAIAESMNLSPSEVDFRPANTDFFVENIDKNLIKIAESLSLTPYEVTIRPANTDMFIENIDKNVTLIKGSTNVVTVSGEYININLPDGGKVQSAQVNGNATQTTYSGKNKIGGFTASATNHGITPVINSDGSIKITGTINTYWATFTAKKDLVIPAGTYTFSDGLTASTRQFGTSIEFVFGDSTTQRKTIAKTSSTGNVSFTLSQPTTQVQIITSTATSGTVVNETIYPQLEAGSTATSYEPFVGGTPAPNPDYPQPISVVTGENVVKVVGKNLIPTRNVQRTTNGITFTPNSDGSVTVDGTATANATYFLNANQSWGVYTIPLKGGETYTINGGSSDGILIQAGLRPTDSGGSATMYPVGTFTPPTDSEAYAYIRISSGTTVNNQTFYVQLEQGSQSTQFEPYQGQDYEVNLGKNLFDKSTVTANYRIGSDGAPFADSSFFLSDYIRVQPSTTYAYSRGSAGSNSSAIAYYKADKTFISRTMPIITNSATSGTVTSPAEAYYARFCDTNANLDTAQLEVGTQATAYAPYFTPIELAKIGTYQDRIYKEGEKWYVEKQVGKVVLDGSENWTKSSTFQGNYYVSTGIQNGKASTRDMMSNLTSTFVITQNQLANSDNCILVELGGAGGRIINFKVSSISTFADFKAFLASTNLVLYYPLQTPTTTEITDQTLIDQLEALAGATLNQGMNNIWIEIATGNAMPTLKLVIEKY